MQNHILYTELIATRVSRVSFIFTALDERIEHDCDESAD